MTPICAEALTASIELYCADGTALQSDNAGHQRSPRLLSKCPPDKTQRKGDMLHAMKPVMAILHLERAGRLAVLCDGQLLLLDADTLEGHPLPGVKVSCKRLLASEPCVLCCGKRLRGPAVLAASDAGSSPALRDTGLQRLVRGWRRHRVGQQMQVTCNAVKALPKCAAATAGHHGGGGGGGQRRGADSRAAGAGA